MNAPGGSDLRGYGGDVSQPSLDLAFDEGVEPTYTVGELAAAINGALRRAFGDGVWVRGEIQGWSERGGHAYFQLVEEIDGAKASIAAQFFANSRARLGPLLRKHRLQLGNGMKVRLYGAVDLYAPSGRLGIKVNGIDPRYTLGEMALERDQVVRQLVADGVFDLNRVRPLPAAPVRIGVVTSVGSAAWHDFADELRASGIGFHIRVADVRVQGDQAVTMVSAAIAALGRHPDLDLIAVVRGGGARSELAVFDAEPVARAIATCPLPVFTGLGHEIDRSVADDVAHTAWKTPTACAGALVELSRGYVTSMETAWAATVVAARRRLERCDAQVTQHAHMARHRVVGAVARADERLAVRAQRVRADAQRALRVASGAIDRDAARLARRVPVVVRQAEAAITHVEARVRALDPALSLARGWSITRSADGRAIIDAATLKPGDALVTTFAAGVARSTVVDTTPEPPRDQRPDHPKRSTRAT